MARAAPPRPARVSRLDTRAPGPYTFRFALKDKQFTYEARTAVETERKDDLPTERQYMPNHKSAEKRMRQNEKRRLINRSNRGRLRTGVKKLRALLEDGSAGDAQALLPQTVSLIDKAVQKGVLHRNAAARYKSRLTQRVNEANAGGE